MKAFGEKWKYWTPHNKNDVSNNVRAALMGFSTYSVFDSFTEAHKLDNKSFSFHFTASLPIQVFPINILLCSIY